MRTNRALVAVTLAAALVLTVAAPAPAQQDPDPAQRETFWNEKTAGVQVNGTYTPIAGDFATTNPQDDIIWYAPGSGVEQVWISLNDGTFAKQPLQQQVNGNYIPLVGDFSGDELDDIFWYGPGSAPDSFWAATSSHTFQSYPMSISGNYYPFVLHDDVTKDNILWWKPGGASPFWTFTGSGAAAGKTTVTPPSSASGPTVGDLDADGNDDLLWYAAGSASDRIDRSNGSGGFLPLPLSVSGTYFPIIGQFTHDEGVTSRGDIVWFSFNGGTMPFWEMNADGSFTKSTISIPLADANPIYLEDDWGYLHLWTEGGTDYIWYDNGVSDYFQPTGNTSMPAGSRPIPRAFKGDSTDIFWYRPGSATDRLFYF